MIRIPSVVLENIIEHSKKDYPLEACGYLVGEGSVVHTIIPMKNIDQSREHFMFEPKEQFEALRKARSLGLRLIGTYHSHPDTPARMSAEDIRLANDPSLYYCIYSVAETNFRCFMVTEQKEVHECEIKIV